MASLEGSAAARPTPSPGCVPQGCVRPQGSREAAGSASWQPQRGQKYQPDRADSINHLVWAAALLHYSPVPKLLLPPTLQCSCSASSRLWDMLWSLYGVRCWQCFCLIFIVDTCYLTLLTKPFTSGASIVKCRSVNVLLLSYNCTVVT